MSSMDIDSPSNFNLSTHRDRIIQRLAGVGVPMEGRDPVESSLIGYVSHAREKIQELVYCILPTDVALTEAVDGNFSELDSGSVDPNLKDIFHESMVWIQWLMFESEPCLALEELSDGRRGVCGAVWGNNDIAYRCRTCEHDPTCAICVPCFQNGHHKDHDYSIIYTGGGCCDCGDATAWKRQGFCSKHKGAEHILPLPGKYANSLGPVLDALLIYWRKKLELGEQVLDDSELTDSTELKEVANSLTFVMVEMLLKFCECSESLLSFISKRIYSSDGLLEILVRAENFLGKDVHKLHELLLKLLGEPTFKYEFSKVFLEYYPSVVNEVVKANSDSVLREHPLLSTFAVQILTVPTLTPRLVKEMNLLNILLGCLCDIFVSCASEDGKLQVAKWGNLYETTLRIIEDIRFVLSHEVVPRYVTHDQREILRTWMKLLASVQGTNPQKRETSIHIEEENENTSLPFILGLTISKIHLLLADGALSETSHADKSCFNTSSRDLDDKDSTRHAKVGRISRESSACSTSLGCSAVVGAERKSENFPIQIPPPCRRLLSECLRAIDDWLRLDKNLVSALSPRVTSTVNVNFQALKKTLSKIRKGKNMFRLSGSVEVDGRNCSTPLTESAAIVDVENHRGSDEGIDASILSGCDASSSEGGSIIEFGPLSLLGFTNWPEIISDVSSQETSIHIPLHRLLSLLLQKALAHCYRESANTSTDSNSLHWDFFGHVLQGCHPYGFSAFVMEHPLRNRVFCAQVLAGMWRRNGDSALLSCVWYRSVRWGGQDLELDLFLLQCCAALAPPDLYVYRILGRFGLSSYLSLNLERASEYEPALVQEMLTLLIHIINERRFCGLTAIESLKRELVHRLAVGDATHSQLVKFLPRDLSKLDELQETLDKVALYSNPSGMNQGMYSLRLPYWKDLDLYHPRWNSKELQFAEERYMRFCKKSPMSNQLPKWAKIHHPLKGIARVATCSMVLQIVRAVIYYAVVTTNKAESRAPDKVVLTSLHLLALALDICFQLKHASEFSNYSRETIPLLTYAVEEVSLGVNSNYSHQCLLSLLVSLMRLCSNQDLGDYVEAGYFNLSSFIGTLLKKFAKLDPVCMEKLQQLAPALIDQLISTTPEANTNAEGLNSDNEKRKARARERQAAIMEKMKADQSKFLASVGPSLDDELDSQTVDQNEGYCHAGIDAKKSIDDVCSLCRESDSGSPLSYLILLQKSRLISFVDRGPSSWEQDDHLERSKCLTSTSRIVDQPARSLSSDNLETLSSSQLIHNLVNNFSNSGQRADINAILEFISTSNEQPAEMNDFLQFIRTHYPAAEYTAESPRSENSMGTTTYSIEKLEEYMYNSIREQMHNYQNTEYCRHSITSKLAARRSTEAEILGNYSAAVSSVDLRDSSRFSGGASSEGSTMSSSSDAFGPRGADGVHLSSCGHAVHQDCVERYLSSLKERHSRRISFEGSHIVDLEKGEFMCPVCRRLANSVLPAVPGTSWKAWTQPKISAAGSEYKSCCLTWSNEGTCSLYLQQALSLLRTTDNVVQKNEKHDALAMRASPKISPNLEPLSRMLCGLYFTGMQNQMRQSRSAHPVIMWDTLKYSIISMEIAARSEGTTLAPNYHLKALFAGLSSSNGFILSLLLKSVQQINSRSSVHVLQRFRGIQLFEESISCDASRNELGRDVCRVVLRLSKDAEKEETLLNTEFWKRASDPVLAHEPFSSLMWVLFCLPYPFLSCKDSFLCLVHLFYVVCVTQVIIAYYSKFQWKMCKSDSQNCLIADICKVMEETGVVKKYLVSNCVDSSNIKDIVRTLSFPYLRRCALLWELVNFPNSVPLCDEASLSNRFSSEMDATVNGVGCTRTKYIELGKLESMFRIPPLDVVLEDEVLRPLALKWLRHLCKESEVSSVEYVLFITPAVPFKLLQLPHIYQEILERYIKQRCPECEPALCLLCGRLCSASLKSCCRENQCQTHAMACGAGTGVFLLIRKTTILLQRSGRRAPWPSPYLDAFGEEDIEMHRGKPLYLNEERYAALTQMVASHGLEQSSKVLGQTTIGSFFMV